MAMCITTYNTYITAITIKQNSRCICICVLNYLKNVLITRRSVMILYIMYLFHHSLHTKRTKVGQLWERPSSFVCVDFRLCAGIHSDVFVYLFVLLLSTHKRHPFFVHSTFWQYVLSTCHITHSRCSYVLILYN